ncbi:hypothetical protein [Sediminibacterium soli]|uniref:hypothetical protein n=1 Tax=Sediminibacterium soli TaxID=2698829 RepID=UPI00137B3E0B|nr:hypothetical protein [Sediminibacterium soli]NCI46812.1 hypothetical protein [Sediminibacterium soli]
MTKKYIYAGLLLAGIALSATRPFFTNPYGFVKGTPQIGSISALGFGQDGILFIGDSKNAAVYAVETRDAKNDQAADIAVTGIDQKIAEALGTQKQNITITDMAVNPVSKKLYVAVQHADGTPALLTVSSRSIEPVVLKDIHFSRIVLNDAVAEDAKGGRGRPLRMSAISDLSFANGKVYVSGLSNKEFSSTFRSIPFPFGDKQEQASLEMYHASHGRYETTSPIRSFTISKVNGKDYLIASYTCTPLVLFPLDELKAGTHVKGRTVAEMGAGNTPIDLTTITKNGQSYLIMGNTARPVSELNYQTIAAFEGTLTERVAGKAGTPFNEVASLTKVLQLDKLDNGKVVIMQKKDNGDIDVLTAANETL